jgi:hypothetical protein
VTRYVVVADILKPIGNWSILSGGNLGGSEEEEPGRSSTEKLLGLGHTINEVKPFSRTAARQSSHDPVQEW